MSLPRPAPGAGRWWVVGVLGVGLMTAVVIWYAVTSTVGALTPRVTHYDIVSDTSATIDYEVLRPQGQAVRCVVAAIDSAKGKVGTMSDDIPAGQDTRVARHLELRTAARATTVVVDSCVRVP